MTNHPAEQAHDEHLYKLLSEQYAAAAEFAKVSRYLRSEVAEVRIGYREVTLRKPWTSSPGGRVQIADLADGLVVEDASGKHSIFVVTNKAGYQGTSRITDVALSAAIDRLVAAATADGGYGTKQFVRRITALVARVAAAQAAFDATVQAVKDHEVNYTGWARYFLVVSSPGHVHSSTSCSTCYSTTQFAPVVILSACTTNEAIALVGDALCSTCFPAVRTGKPKKVALKTVKTILSGQVPEAEQAPCTGSGGRGVVGVGRSGYYTGNWGQCPACGERVTLTSSNVLRKHASKV